MLIIRVNVNTRSFDSNLSGIVNFYGFRPTIPFQHQKHDRIFEHFLQGSA